MQAAFQENVAFYVIWKKCIEQQILYMHADGNA